MSSLPAEPLTLPRGLPSLPLPRPQSLYVLASSSPFPKLGPVLGMRLAGAWACPQWLTAATYCSPSDPMGTSSWKAVTEDGLRPPSLWVTPVLAIHLHSNYSTMAKRWASRWAQVKPGCAIPNSFWFQCWSSVTVQAGVFDLWTLFSVFFSSQSLLLSSYDVSFVLSPIKFMLSICSTLPRIAPTCAWYPGPSFG